MAKPSHIIDSHQHVFWHGRDDHDLVADMDDHGIERAWLLTWHIAREEDYPGYHRVLNPRHMRDDGTHAGILLEDILQTRDKFPDRFYAGYCPHPLQPSAPHLLYNAAHTHDIRVCGEWKFRVLFDDPRCMELFRVAGELKMPVVLHLDVPYLLNKNGEYDYQPLWYGGTVENLERALQACPETNFVGHAPGFWREIAADAATATTAYPKGPVSSPGRLYDLFDNYSNLYADLSAGSGLFALHRDPDHARRFLTRFADHLLFGRDYYGTELHDFLQTLDLSPEVTEKIYYQNAHRLLAPSESREKPKLKTIYK